MNKLYTERKSSKYQNQIFLLVFLVAAIPLLIAGGLSYGFYMEEVTKQNDLSMKATEIQVYNEVENILSGIREYYMEKSVSDEIAWLKKTDGIPYTQYSYLNAAQDVLGGPNYLWDYIESYAFVNLEKDWVLTNNGMFRLSDVKNKEQTERFFKRLKENSVTPYWKAERQETSPYEKGLFESNCLDVSGFHMIHKFAGKDTDMAQVLLVKINEEKLGGNLRENTAVYDLCILTQTGDVLYASDDDLAHCLSGMVETLKSTQESNCTMGENEAEYRIRSKGLSPNGMVYVTAYNLSHVKETGSGFLTISFVVLGVLALLLLICRLITLYLYKPVKNIASYVSDVADAQGETASEENQNEFTVIRQKVGYLVNAKENLQQMLERHQRLLLEQFLIRTVRGELTQEEVSAGEKQFGIKTEKQYRMLAIVCLMENGAEDGQEKNAVSISVAESMSEKIRESLVTVPFCYGEQILLVIGGENGEEILQKTENVYALMNEHIEKQFGLSMLAGASEIFPKLKYLKTAYNECRETLLNARAKASSDITYYEDIAGDEGIIGGYDFVVENSLIKAVNNGDTETALQQIDKFVNSLDNRGIKSHDRNFYLYRLMVAVLSTLSDAGLTANQVYGGERFSEDVFKQLNFIYDSGSLKEYLGQQMIVPAIETLKQYRYDSSSNIMLQIVELVKETKGDITLSECADKLSYHPSYIWKVLKAERNMTFTELVNEEKAESAKRMLSSTDYTVAEIAEKLNYSNTQNFIRFFSKYVGTSPGKYRKEFQDSQNENG